MEPLSKIERWMDFDKKLLLLIAFSEAATEGVQ